jgi:xanthine dehydrogenase accessory factor
MNHSGVPLGELFHRHRDAGEPLVLATVVQTLGSTYRKAGAQMLIAADGRAAGLLSGGCLEADLMERARSVLDTGRALIVEYDTRSSDDVLWGIGLGCEGAMTILLTRLDRSNDYQPFAFIERCRHEDLSAKFALVSQTDNAAYSLGSAYWPGVGRNIPAAVSAALASSSPGALTNAARNLRGSKSPATTVAIHGATFLVVSVELPPRLLVLGAGPDAMPLVEIAGLMSWHVTVLDHRPAYAIAERFPRAQRVALNSAANLAAELQASSYDAAVVMSHHLLSDQAYLATLADSDVPYIGLLGPAPRRVRLMSEIGEKAAALASRLHGPIGLDIGAQSPETIALAIVSEIQAFLADRPGGSFSAKQRAASDP